MRALFEGKKILVTGGTGSIGQAVVQEILKYDPAVVRILDVHESEQFEMKQDLEGYSNVRFLLGDVRDKERLFRAIEEIDIVFHMASLKHVLACEYNPFEAIKTNVIGTQNLIDVAMEEEVDKVVFTSSDKAVNPCNVLGATKLLAERLITAANYYKGPRKTIFSSVRFGNVLGSRGSVIPVFKKQMQNNGLITVTDPYMTRFVMDMSQAVNFLFKATEMAQGGEIFIFKMPTVRILDLAEVMIEESLRRSKDNENGVKIRTVGKNAGEKMFEELMTESEAERCLETEDMFIVLPEVTEYGDIDKSRYPGAKYTKLKSYITRDVRFLTKEEIKDILYRACLM
jgi:UDP-N-acetylglucosamine 4,6-dehydratase